MFNPLFITLFASPPVVEFAAFIIALPASPISFLMNDFIMFKDNV